jgi:predicted ATP-grasp superfamily ATP-dependent carboligase
VGLNGVDFLLEGGRWTLLEVNPRPPATMELYEPDYPRGLLHAHLSACAGTLPDRARKPRACRAFAIVTAPADVTIEGERLPAWCRDRPCGETRFRPGNPVCTVHASASTPGEARRRVALRRRRLVRLLERAALVPA